MNWMSPSPFHFKLKTFRASKEKSVKVILTQEPWGRCLLKFIFSQTSKFLLHYSFNLTIKFKRPRRSLRSHISGFGFTAMLNDAFLFIRVIWPLINLLGYFRYSLSIRFIFFHVAHSNRVDTRQTIPTIHNDIIVCILALIDCPVTFSTKYPCSVLTE